MTDRESTVLEVTNLKTELYTVQGWLPAVDAVSFSISQGEILGVVGESGCGKSVMAMSLLRLNDPKLTRYGGSVRVGDAEFLSLSEQQLQLRRGRDVSMIFQDPLSSLNPLMTIGAQIVEPLRTHQNLSRADARRKALELLKLTEIPDPEGRFEQFPHEISGGMRQRVMIAMALACNPRLLIADEPTTALDVTIQLQVLRLIKSLRSRTGMAVLMITHDLGVVSEVCERVAVMYLGQFIEVAPVADLFERPLHPYTRGLLSAMPSMAMSRHVALSSIPGAVPPLNRIPPGCRFAPRCSFATDRCMTEVPPLEADEREHLVRCWNFRQIDGTVQHA